MSNNCEHCGQNTATVKIMIQNKIGQEEGILNLCQVCFDDFAKEHPDMKPAADFGAMIQAFFNMFNGNNLNNNSSISSNNKDNNIDKNLNLNLDNVKNKLLDLMASNNININDAAKTGVTENNNDNSRNLTPSKVGAKKFNSNRWKNSLNKICPNCKSTSKIFMTTGRVGCEKCYLAFKEEINEKLLTMTGENIITKFNKTTISVKSKVYILKKDLDEAVEREDYELAAKIRDDLKILVKSE